MLDGAYCLRLLHTGEPTIYCLPVLQFIRGKPRNRVSVMDRQNQFLMSSG